MAVPSSTYGRVFPQLLCIAEPQQLWVQRLWHKALCVHRHVGIWERRTHTLRGSRSSSDMDSCVIGHFPVSLTYFSIKAFSNRCPDLVLITGCSGTLPEIAQNMVAGAPQKVRSSK